MDYPATQAGISVYENYFPKSRWALVYWDDVSLIYLKRVPEYKDVIARTEFKTITPDLPPGDFLSRLATGQISLEASKAELLRNQGLHPESRLTNRLWMVLESSRLKTSNGHDRSSLLK
jgi:hypothetical protein